MRHVRRLKPECQSRILEAVSNAYKTTLDAFDKADRRTPRRHLTRDVGDLILRAVNDAIAVNHGLENTRFSLQHRLPNELWCAVWQYMDQDGRTDISQACPALWNHLTFFTTIGKCYGGYYESRYDDDKSNFCNAGDLLARSGNLPLRLRLDIDSYVADRDVLNGFMSALDNHSTRLTGLHVHSEDMAALKAFLMHFTTLPALKSLFLQQPHHNRRQPQSCWVRLDYLTLPRLETVHFDVGFFVLPTARVFTSVRTLSINLRKNPGKQLIGALSTFPEMKTLFIDFDHLEHGAGPGKHLEELRRLAARIPAVVMTSARVAWPLTAFHDTARRRFVLQDWYTASDTVDYRSIMRDVGKDVTLSVVVQRGRVVVQAIDSSGSERRIDAAYDEAARIHGAGPGKHLEELRRLAARIPAVVMTSARVAWPLTAFHDTARRRFVLQDWYTASDTVDYRSIMRDVGKDVTLSVVVQRGRVVVQAIDSSGSERRIDAAYDEAARILMPCLPALRTLRITGNGPRLVELCAKDIIDIARVLDLPCPLEALQIDHRIFEAGESEREMHHLAETVVAPLALAFQYHAYMDLSSGHYLCALLERVLYRVRSFEFHAPDINIYLPIFELLCRRAPLLMSLDLASTGHVAAQMARGDLPPYDEHLALLSQQLQYLDCDEHRLPPASTVFRRVTYLRIAVSTRDREALEHLFAQFPCVTTLCVYHTFAGRSAPLPSLPAWHPLQRLEICAKPNRNNREGPQDMSWAELGALGFLRVAELEINDFTFPVLVEASRDPEWTARSVGIDIGSVFDAMFVSGTRTCKMSCLTPRNARHKLEAQKLMYRNSFWHSVTSLTVSTVNPPRGDAVALLFPVVRTPELITLTVLVEFPALNNAGLNWSHPPTSLFDTEISSTCGVLRAGQLQAIRLVAKASKWCWRASPEPGAVPASALAGFVSRHIRCDGGRIHKLVCDGPRVRLLGDEQDTLVLHDNFSHIENML
ncbi:hypothetical protein AURDEDRAFT_124887 [Auricularia subglabra TFB-10046 SS5]|nr:hypothetical protein AURDEDRAFT_124887 [Auricularia subglabra TFB-10046 SS5]